MIRGTASAFLLAAVVAAVYAEAPRQVTQATAPPSGHAALARKEWARAIEAFAAAERSDIDVPAATRGLGAAHAGAGHELAAVAWYRAWLHTLPPGETGREDVVKEIAGLEVRAETKIRRLAQEASDVLDDIGEGDAARTARLRKLALQAALTRGDMATAQETVRLVAADDAGRDAAWSEAALALATDDDFENALAAAARITNVAKRNDLVKSLESRRASARQILPAVQWRALARDLSKRREIVALDAELQDVAKGPAADVPLRLLAISTRLQLAFARIQRLKELR